MNRAYCWLSDGQVIGYRDLDTGLDHLDSTVHLGVYLAAIEEWLMVYGVTCRRVGPQQPAQTVVGRGPVAWWRRRRAERADRARAAAWRDWQLDRPSWRVPTDPPNGGWRDLVRNDAGVALWARAAVDQPTSWHDWGGYSRARAWRVGAVGEESVGAELWRLVRTIDAAWRFVHSVPVGSRGSDIDHVLVGPGGIFTINTKAHLGSNIWVAGDTFMVNGQRHGYIRNSRFEAERARRLIANVTGLDLPVRGLIVVVDPRGLTIRQAPDGVAVTTRHQLVKWLASQPHVLAPAAIDRAFDAIRRSSTWTANTRTNRDVNQPERA